jgi:hypothetical protein
MCRDVAPKKWFILEAPRRVDCESGRVQFHLHCSHCTMYILVVYFYKFNPGVDRWQLLTTHTSKSLCKPDMRISLFNCDVSQTLFVIKIALLFIKDRVPALTIFLTTSWLKSKPSTVLAGTEVE